MQPLGPTTGTFQRLGTIGWQTADVGEGCSIRADVGGCEGWCGTMRTLVFFFSGGRTIKIAARLPVNTPGLRHLSVWVMETCLRAVCRRGDWESKTGGGRSGQSTLQTIFKRTRPGQIDPSATQRIVVWRRRKEPRSLSVWVGPRPSDLGSERAGQ